MVIVGDDLALSWFVSFFAGVSQLPCPLFALFEEGSANLAQ